MSRAAKAVAVALWILLGLVVFVTLPGCGVPKPLPVVPPGQASCDEACRHLANDMPLCGTSEGLCLRHCRAIARNDPGFPTCVARAQSCPAANACGGDDDDTLPPNLGPGEGRNGP